MELSNAEIGERYQAGRRDLGMIDYGVEVVRPILFLAFTFALFYFTLWKSLK